MKIGFRAEPGFQSIWAALCRAKPWRRKAVRLDIQGDRFRTNSNCQCLSHESRIVASGRRAGYLGQGAREPIMPPEARPEVIRFAEDPSHCEESLSNRQSGRLIILP